MKHIIFSLVFTVWLSLGAFAQSAKINPLVVERSTLVEQIRALNRSNAKLTTAELASAANGLLEKNGINFVITVDRVTCEKLKDRKGKSTSPLALGASLRSVGADKAALSLPAPHLVSAECGGCYVELPLVQITEVDIVTVLMGQNIKFMLPDGIQTNEVALFDPKDQAKVKTRWKIPFRATPIGITYDGNVVYLGFEEPELSELALAAFSEGVFQITTRVEAEDGGKGQTVETPLAKRKDAFDQMVRFDRWKNTYLIGFKKSCAK